MMYRSNTYIKAEYQLLVICCIFCEITMDSEVRKIESSANVDIPMATNHIRYRSEDLRKIGNKANITSHLSYFLSWYRNKDMSHWIRDKKASKTIQKIEKGMQDFP